MRTGEAAPSKSLWLWSVGPDVNVATCTCHCEYAEGACIQGNSAKEHLRLHEGPRRRGQADSIEDGEACVKYFTVASVCREPPPNTSLLPMYLPPSLPSDCQLD